MSSPITVRFRGTRYTLTAHGAEILLTPEDGRPATAPGVVEGTWIVTSDRRVRWTAVRSPKGIWVCVDGFTAFLEYADTDEAELGAGGDEVRAPMTGTVVSVDVAPGDAVTTGDVLVVLTAMKMEYKLEAPRDGVVASVGCAAGEQVEMGQVLAGLKPAVAAAAEAAGDA